MSTGQVLLGFLAECPKHGYELKKEHDHRLAGARPLAYGQVYATLQRLERDGLAEVAETQQEGGPERILYAITDAGRAELARWLDTVEPSAPYVASPCSPGSPSRARPPTAISCGNARRTWPGCAS